MTVAIKVINQGEARVIAVIIQARNVHQVIKSKFAFRERTDFRESLIVRDGERELIPEFNRL